MRRIIRGIGALVLLVVAQNVCAVELSAGARIGMNLSGILGDTVNSIMAPRFGITGGFFCSQWINDRLGLQEELGFSFRGESWKDPDKYISQIANKYAFRFTYIEVPVLVRWKFIKQENVRPVLYAGPLFAMPIIAESETLPGNTEDMKEKTQPFDLGLTAGLSFEVKQGNAVIPIDIRYTWGATNYLKNPDYNLELHHSVVSISAGLGWIMDFAKKKEF
jgi:hypothetical protein